MTTAKAIFHNADCFYSVDIFFSKRVHWAPMVISPKCGDDEVMFPGTLLFPRSLAGTGKPFFFFFLNLYVLSFLCTGPVFEFSAFFVPCHASGVLSLVSCSLSIISSWGGLALSKNPHFHKAKVKMARTNNPRSIASIITHNGIEKETFGVAQITDVLIAMLPSGSFAG